MCVKSYFSKITMINFNRRISFCTWNINGLNSKIIGDKTECLDFINTINKHDFVILTETWTSFIPEIEGYKHISVCSEKNVEKKKSGRRSGEISIVYKKCF